MSILIIGTFLKAHIYQTKILMGVCNQAGFCKMYSERGHQHSLKHLPKLSEVRTKLVILTMTFLITHKLRNVGGPRQRPTWPMPKNGPYYIPLPQSIKSHFISTQQSNHSKESPLHDTLTDSQPSNCERRPKFLSQP